VRKPFRLLLSGRMTIGRSSLDMPQLYYINLERRSDRRRFQERQAKLHGLSLNRVPAKDGEEGSRRLPDSGLSPGARGLWITFLDLVGALAADGDDVVVVLEDDAVLHPLFKRSLRKTLDELPDDVALIQFGYIGLSAWRSNKSVWENVKKFLRPRTRLREMRDSTRECSGDARFVTSLFAGTHCLVIFPKRLVAHLEQIRSGELPLDRAFVEYARSHPGVFVRVRRNRAYQLPFESDIPWERASRRESATGANVCGG
jgi:GR25 family glycosyltransferase involved in LPS biosynthesis